VRYRDRIEAGRRLADAIEDTVAFGPAERLVVLGVPRGGVPVAAVVADRLGAELDVLVAHKIGVPGNPEFAIGAVAEDGTTILDVALVERLGISDDYIARETRIHRDEVKQRSRYLRAGRAPIPLTGRTCLVIDDGVATGSTLEASLRLVVAAGAERVIAAVPVGPPETILRLAGIVDGAVCPLQPDAFFSVGAWYDDFIQVPDEAVVEILRVGEGS
jgi:putative phosphoribosyl transferase